MNRTLASALAAVLLAAGLSSAQSNDAAFDRIDHWSASVKDVAAGWISTRAERPTSTSAPRVTPD